CYRKMADHKVSLVLLVTVTPPLAADVICSVEHCTNSTRCLLSEDQRRCKCANGYYSDLYARIKVVCGKDFIAIRAMEDYFTFHSVPLEEVINGVPYFVSKISKDKYQMCRGKALTKKNQISYSPSLQSEPQVIGNIVRNPVIKMNYTCVYPSIRTVIPLFLPFPPLHAYSELVMHLDERSTIHYSFDMFRFTAEPHDLYLSCTLNCNSMSKREAMRSDLSRMDHPDRDTNFPSGILRLKLTGEQ
uniref:Uncharacterized protein n=1 Tax=Gasterosteus aculeatus aculeatus TaxID=481459 RepID=A0AAQ4PJ36_GASAC